MNRMSAADPCTGLFPACLSADAFAAFEEAGNVFDPATAERLYTHIYSSGNSRDPSETYRLFRGRDPDVSALLRNRGFATAESVTD